jgi:hypothetical protein
LCVGEVGAGSSGLINEFDKTGGGVSSREEVEVVEE